MKTSKHGPMLFLFQWLLQAWALVLWGQLCSSYNSHVINHPVLNLFMSNAG